MTYEDIRRFRNIDTLRTERLILRRLSVSDFEDVYKYASDGRVTEYLLWSPHKTLMQSRRYLIYVDKKYRRAEFYDWGIEYNGHIIGTCGFTSFSVENNSAEVGYVLGSEFWGMGIAAEALRVVIRYGFDILSLNRIEGKYMADNARSLSVMKKCQMTHEGVHRSMMLVKGEYRDIGVCAITRADYLSSLKI